MKKKKKEEKEEEKKKTRMHGGNRQWEMWFECSPKVSPLRITNETHHSIIPDFSLKKP